ncbi:uncharacterized protein E5676_scaffold121G00140 [Cucumis melo var. makuwa]|uniref:Uncharacterized protein n=1 Tax=Cucumis melo var. makuwa TaxID=1194695 RepID=A0A5D3BZ06_CUCMM|nr:uncharacterized protein E5676_scaffold121G00140 [Cucumis melo var. makuwa]
MTGRLVSNATNPVSCKTAGSSSLLEKELLWLFLLSSNSNLFNEMGHISWEKNHAVASDLLSRQVATFLLLLVLSGPVKALTYLLRHGLVGFTMGSLWRLGANWSTSIFLCTIVRAFGAVGYVLVSSFLIRENILSLITINIHASLTLIFTAWGVNLIPSMNAIYAIFGTLTWFEDFIDITTVAGKGNVNILSGYELWMRPFPNQIKWK